MILILGVLLISVFSQRALAVGRSWLHHVGPLLRPDQCPLYVSRGNSRAPIFAKRLKLMTPYDKKSDKRLYNAVALAILLCVFIVSVPRHWEF